MDDNQKQTLWQSVEDVHLLAMPDGAQILTDSREVLTKEDGRWWQNNGIIANMKSVKKIIIIPEE
jgi:hypothetical protein